MPSADRLLDRDRASPARPSDDAVRAVSTRERILDAADRLFGERGYERTSMRALTREAGVNLAAVNYHFGSKLELLRGALSRHLEAVNAERLRILDKLEAQGPRALSVEAVLDALFRPCVEFTHISARHAARIRGVIALVFREPPELIRPLIDELFHAVHERFVAALARQLPELPLELVELRVQLGIGSMIHLIANRAPPIIRLDESRSTDELVAFVAGALRAPALPSPKKDGLR